MGVGLIDNRVKGICRGLGGVKEEWEGKGNERGKKWGEGEQRGSMGERGVHGNGGKGGVEKVGAREENREKEGGGTGESLVSSSVFRCNSRTQLWMSLNDCGTATSYTNIAALAPR